MDLTPEQAEAAFTLKAVVDEGTEQQGMEEIPLKTDPTLMKKACISAGTSLS